VVYIYFGVGFFAFLLIFTVICWISTIYQKIKDPFDDLQISDEDINSIIRPFMYIDKFVMTSLTVRCLCFIIISAGLFLAACLNMVSNVEFLVKYFIDY